jgi:hypothetical protein
MPPRPLRERMAATKESPMRPTLLITAATPVALVCALSVGAQQPRPIRATQLLAEFVRAHVDLAALELAVDTTGGCRTVAASDPKDIGERCDADELGPMRTGTPDVEAPTRADPVYDITQALHDSAGRLIGAVGMDLPPRGQGRAAVVARALRLLRELEARIPSKASLLTPVAP